MGLGCAWQAGLGKGRARSVECGVGRWDGEWARGWAAVLWGGMADGKGPTIFLNVFNIGLKEIYNSG